MQKGYESFLEKETERCIRFQDEIGIDVPVHGEFERNDMVEYFGEQLAGFTFTANGWVQSYGSRCVKPPGDLRRRLPRPTPMTVRWSKYAQTLTEQPVKGMLTGPVTILQWSFVARRPAARDDVQADRPLRHPRRGHRPGKKPASASSRSTSRRCARACPCATADKKSYLKWAVDAFRLSSSGVEDATQIHTHMCYCEFGDIMDSIASLDADVISIETSRSRWSCSPISPTSTTRRRRSAPASTTSIRARVPKQEEMVALLRKALDVFAPEQLWGEPRLRPQDARLEGNRARASRHGRGAKQVRAELQNSQSKAANSLGRPRVVAFVQRNIFMLY